MKKATGYWTKEKCQEVSIECENRNQFNKKYRSAYNSAYRNNWLDEICNHMTYENHLHDNYWNKEKCQEVSLRYQTRSDFCKKYKTAYNKSLKYGWLDEICSHMKICGNSHHRLIYLFEFNDNNVYIGLTYNYENRCNEHLITDKSSSVYKHIEKTGLIPTYKKLTDYIDIEDAMSFEKYYIIHYKAVEKFSDNKCKDCIFEPSCPTCYGMNYVNNGNMFNRDKTMCNIVKITALAVSYLKANQIESKSKEISPNDTYQTIKAIQLIQNQF